MACQINVQVEWPRTVPVEIRSADPITVTVDTTQGLPGPQGPPGPGSEVQDTDWLDIPRDPAIPGATIKIRRYGPLVYMTVQMITSGPDPRGKLLTTLPVGFRPPFGSFSFGPVLNTSTMGFDGALVVMYNGAAQWMSDLTAGAVQMSWLTPDTFPET